MIEGLTILAGDDRVDQALSALQGRAHTQLIQIRVGHFAAGHDAASDDARTYRQMLDKVDLYYLQPIKDRTDGRPSAVEYEGAATAALKLAAICWAIADKAHRDADRRRALEAAQASQQED